VPFATIDHNVRRTYMLLVIMDASFYCTGFERLNMVEGAMGDVLQ
jgi:hypothetical protein